MLLNIGRKLEPFFFTLLFSGFIFNIKFKGLPPSFLVSSFFLFFIAFFFFLKGYEYPRVLVKPFVFFVPFILSVIVTLIVNSRFDGHLIILIAAIFFILTIGVYAVFSYFKGREIEVVKYIFYAGFLNSIFIILMFLSSSFRDIYLSTLSKVDLLYVKGEGALDSLYSMRMIGLTGSATYSMAVVQVLMCFFYIFYVKSKGYIFTLFNLIPLLLLAFSALLSGRTAFIGFFFLMFYIALLFSKVELVKLFIVFLISLISFLLLATSLLPENIYMFFERWVLQIFTEGVNVASVSENKAMLAAYQLSDFSVFGDFKWHGNELRNTYYMNTDVGWFRFAFAFGFSGLVFLILHLLSFINIKLIFNYADIALFLIVFFILTVMFKGAFLFDFYIVYFFLSALYFFSLINWNDY